MKTDSMKNPKLRIGLIIFLVGFVGLLSTLTMEIPIPEQARELIGKMFTPWQFKMLFLINPTILLLIGTVVGTLLYNKVNLQLPLFEGLVYRMKIANWSSFVKYGFIGGIVAGLLILIVSASFHPVLPSDYLEIGEKYKPGIAARFLYGGLTEEIMIRFGLMTFLVWLLFKIFKKLTPAIYWVGILISAIAFGFGHFPMVYALMGTPPNSVLIFILCANAVGGIVFGWLYWKKGLASAIIGHILAHVIMLLGDFF